MTHALSHAERRVPTIRAAFLAAVVALATVASARADDGGHPAGNPGGGQGGGQSAGGHSAVAPAAPSSGNAFSPGVRPGSPDDLKLVRAAEANGQAMPLGKILPALKRAAPGKILNVAFARVETGFRYTFTMLTAAGRYIEVSIDAKTSELLGVRRR
jgi:hypothetical protein